MDRIKRILEVGGAALFLLPVLGRAQVAPQYETVEELISNVLCPITSYMYRILILVSVIMVLVGAYFYVTAGGQEEKVRTGTKTITYAAVAVVIALVSFSLPSIIHTLIGGNFSSSVFRPCG